MQQTTTKLDELRNQTFLFKIKIIKMKLYINGLVDVPVRIV